jgi:hypothetical protein
MSFGSALLCSSYTCNIQKNLNQFDRLSFKRLLPALARQVEKAIKLGLTGRIYGRHFESHLSIE